MCTRPPCSNKVLSWGERSLDTHRAQRHPHCPAPLAHCSVIFEPGFRLMVRLSEQSFAYSGHLFQSTRDGTRCSALHTHGPVRRPLRSAAQRSAAPQRAPWHRRPECGKFAQDVSLRPSLFCFVLLSCRESKLRCARKEREGERGSVSHCQLPSALFTLCKKLFSVSFFFEAPLSLVSRYRSSELTKRSAGLPVGRHFNLVLKIRSHPVPSSKSRLA